MSARISFTAGFMVRRVARFKGASLGLKVQEFKGLLESGFVMEGDDNAVRRMLEWFRQQDGRKSHNNARLAAQAQLAALGKPVDPLLKAALDTSETDRRVS